MKPSVLPAAAQPWVWIAAAILAVLLPASRAWAQAPACRPPASLRFAGMPAVAFPYRRFKKPYHLYLMSPRAVAYDGAARSAPKANWRRLAAVKIGFLGPLQRQYANSVYGISMLHGAELALAKANRQGGYHGKPFVLEIHNDKPLWGASAMAIVHMRYRQHVWAMLGSVDGASTHIELRATLKIQLPIVDTATTDPTVTETRIPWLLHNFPDDRQQGYALADYIFNQLHLKNVAIMRATNRYGRLGFSVFFDTARRMGHPPAVVLTFAPYQTHFGFLLRELQQMRVQGVVLWCAARQAGLIVRQMRTLGMRQPVFGGSRVAYPELITAAGVAANGVVAVAAINPDSSNPRWLQFRRRFVHRFHSQPGAYAAYAYDGMTMLIGAIRKAGLNRALIMDALRGYQMKAYHGVSGTAFFDNTLNNIAPVTMAKVVAGHFVYWPEQRTDWRGHRWPACLEAAN